AYDRAAPRRTSFAERSPRPARARRICRRAARRAVHRGDRRIAARGAAVRGSRRGGLRARRRGHRGIARARGERGPPGRGSGARAHCRDVAPLHVHGAARDPDSSTARDLRGPVARHGLRVAGARDSRVSPADASTGRAMIAAAANARAAAAPRRRTFAVLELMRPKGCAGAACYVLLSAWASGAQAAALGTLVAALVVALIVGAAFTFNDVQDVHTDSLIKPSRPLPSRRISPRAACWAAAALAASALIGAATLGSALFAFAVVYVAASALYSTH